MSEFAVRTRSGLTVSILAPDPALIRLTDIAHHLSLVNRYCGATELGLSVAQHSVVVSRALEAFGARQSLLALLHDAHEYLTGDVTSPMKRALAHVGQRDLVASIQANIDRAIWTAFNISPPTPVEADAIARADEGALVSEWRKLMPGEPPSQATPVQLAWAVSSPARAAEAFLTRFDRLQALLPGVKRP